MNYKQLGLISLAVQQGIYYLKNKGLRLNAGVIYRDDKWLTHAHVTEYYKQHNSCERCNPPKELVNGI